MLMRLVLIVVISINGLHVFAQPTLNKLENHYWTLFKSCTNDSCLTKSKDTFTNIYLLKVDYHFHGKCEVYMSEYELIEDPVEGIRRWFPNGCTPYMVIKKAISDSVYQIEQLSEAGKYFGVLRISNEHFTFVGESEEHEKIVEEYDAVKIPKELEYIIPQKSKQ